MILDLAHATIAGMWCGGFVAFIGSFGVRRIDSQTLIRCALAAWVVCGAIYYFGVIR